MSPLSAVVILQPDGIRSLLYTFFLNCRNELKCLIQASRFEKPNNFRWSSLALTTNSKVCEF